jgi:CheY-like chemotaxis protein
MQTTGETILLAEEDGAMRRCLAEHLTADGYRILEADDRAKALALLSVNQPDLIVLDVNGQTLAVIDAVRSGEGLAGRVDPQTPMIVLSAQADRIHRIRVLERGGDDIVAKPFAGPCAPRLRRPRDRRLVLPRSPPILRPRASRRRGARIPRESSSQPVRFANGRAPLWSAAKWLSKRFS